MRHRAIKLDVRQGAAFQEVEVAAFRELGGLAQIAGIKGPRGWPTWANRAAKRSIA
jgi:hypothetical protein